MKYFLDAQGTDGTDPAKVMRVYEDGTRIPLSEPELETPDMLDDASIRATFKDIFARLELLEKQMTTCTR